MDDAVFTVCCPSYKRPKVETLDIYPHTRVYVAESELEAYREANEGADIVAVPDRVQGNVSRIRNYILDSEFSDGVDGVLILDDDVQSVARYRSVEASRGRYGYQQEVLDEEALYEFLAEGFSLCEQYGYKFWGVNCVVDPKAYLQGTPFNTLKFIGGPFQAHLNNPLRYDEELPLKEDYDMTLQHLHKYGGALRFNAYHYTAKQSQQAGGCASYRNMKSEREQFDRLQRKWGSDVIRHDGKSKKSFDYNPVMVSPIPGI